jgi:serine/threonine protein kinase
MTSTVDDDAADPLVGSVLNERYRLDARLGNGGMGAVYRARHLALHRDVAIKVLHAHLSEDPMVGKRFDREALAASKLDHPQCVQVLDTGTAENGLRYLVMQLLDGRELRRAIDGPMPVRRVIDIARQILLGLEHAHGRGLVHRDLKPENVFLVRGADGREVVKLVDFGIVKVLTGDGSNESLTRAGMVFGTAGYMSPEQAAGGKIDERADLYAVGVLMYEMLTGAPPFQGDDLPTVLRMQLLSEPKPLPDTVPPELSAVVMRLLRNVAKERFPTAREAREALEAAAHDDPVAAVSMSAPRHRRVVFMRADALHDPKPARARRGGLLLAVLAAIGILSSAAAFAFALDGCAPVVQR